MVVQHNLRAMNSNRLFGLTTAAQSKSTEKLSSGYKINRAADDAAGLSISEKMRKQIRGLTQASLNAQDGISAVQTAEGALTEVHDMLQRMNELAVKASNGTMSENDRSYVQNEIDQLVTEIDRVAETTKFNETYLLKGNGVKDPNADKTYSDLGADKAIVAKLTNADDKRVAVNAATDIKTGKTELNLGDLKKIKAGDSIIIDGVTYTFDAATNATVGHTLTSGAVTIGSQSMSSDAIATAIANAITTRSTTMASADPNSANIASVAVMKNADGDFILTAQSKLDAYRVKTGATATTYSTDGGAVLITNTNKTITDGDIITIGTVELVGKMTDATGTTVSPKTGTYSINLDKYEGQEMSLVYDDADGGSWSTTDAEGNVVSYTTAELLDMGIGISNDNGKTLEKLDKANDGFVDTSALAKGFTLTIKKGAVKPENNSDLVNSANINLEGIDLSKYQLGDEIKVQANVSKGGTISFSDVLPGEEEAALELDLQVGADTTEENKISLTIESMSAKSLGIEGLKVDGKDSSNADNAVNVIADAIQKVSTQRSALGAVQNRLEHTINNLDNVVENTTAAESQIRDTDMATEMVKYSNNNILAQAGQAMLAQANQSNQGVLSLLQ